MNHAVFYRAEVCFDGVVDVFRDLMGALQRLRAVGPDFHVHIHAVAEHTGIEKIQTEHSRLRKDKIPHPSFCDSVAGRVQHAVQRLPENVYRNLQDEQADDQTGGGIRPGETETSLNEVFPLMMFSVVKQVMMSGAA